jgi:DNA helicase-2/ATP-dependent DNA helicase PcrA
MKLNRQQSLAARPSGGVECIIAGAGTGKTRTLIAKVKNIISSGMVPPEKILLLTFSRKAADEIRERIRHDLGSAADAITAGTFHSFCLSFLRSLGDDYKRMFGYERFPSVIEEDERLAIHKKLIADRIDSFLGIPLSVICGIIQSSHQMDTYFTDKLDRFGILKEFDEIKKQYIIHKRSHGLIDFEDMIEHTISVINSNETIRSGLCDRYRYILVDEFQDTSDNNFELLKSLLPDKGGNLFVVGDDWQSIYGFRKARVEYIVSIKKYFTQANIITLSKITAHISRIHCTLKQFIRKNRFRTSKKLVSTRGKGGTIKACPSAVSMKKRLP